MRQGAARHEVDAELADRREPRQRDAARRLELRPAVHELDRIAHRFVGHVVEQNVLRARLGRLGDLFQTVRLDLDLQLRILFADLRHAPGNAAGALQRGEFAVVVLDHRPVVQTDPVIARAAHRDGVFLEIAVAGRGLAGVEQHGFASRERRRVTVRGRCDAAEPLDEIERGPFGGQQRLRVAGNFGDHFARLTQFAVRLEHGVGAHRVEPGEHPAGDLLTGDDHVRLLAAEHGLRPALRRNDRERRHVAELAQVLLHGHFNQRVDPVPVDRRNSTFHFSPPLYSR